MCNKILIFISLLTINIFGDKIKMYALHTPSHQILVDKYFIPSIKDNFDLKIEMFSQKCLTAEFNSKGWNHTMLDKVDVIINAIKENFGKIFIFSDVDIIFIKPVEAEIKHLMNKYEFVIQKSSIQNKQACTGFFAIIGNEKTLKLWQDIKEYMLTHPKLSEENVLNDFIKAQKLKHIKWCYLPIKFYNGGMLTSTRWLPGKDLEIPKDIVLHHANWTTGIENKVKQIEYVLGKIKKKA